MWRLGLLTLLLILSACSVESDVGLEPACPDPLGRLSCASPNTSPVGAVRVYELLVNSDRAGLVDILDPSFRFVVSVEDSGRFPWAEDGAWNRRVEEQIIRALSDGSTLPDLPIEIATLTLDVLREVMVTDPMMRWQITAEAELLVLAGPGEGLGTSTLVEFSVVPDLSREGRFLVLELKEVGPASSVGDLRADTWAGIWGAVYSAQLISVSN